MRPEVLWRSIITNPVRLHVVYKIGFPTAKQSLLDVLTAIRAVAVAVLVECAVALVRPQPVDAPRVGCAEPEIPELCMNEETARGDDLRIVSSGMFCS